MYPIFCKHNPTMLRFLATWWPLSFAGAFSATQQSPGDAAKRGRVCTGAAGAGSREAGLGSAFENPKGNGFGDP